MTYRGRVKNGQITLDEAVRLPEGAEVNVAVLPEPEKAGGSQVILERRKHRIRVDAELARHIASDPEFHPDEF